MTEADSSVPDSAPIDAAAPPAEESVASPEPSLEPNLDRFGPGEPAIIVDRKMRKYLMFLRPGKSFKLRGGRIECDDVIGLPTSDTVKSSTGEIVRLYRPSFEEYVLHMPRGAQIISPKDIGPILVWGDIFPGARVVEAGIGSGSLTLGLLRMVGDDGKVIAFELREDFANCARNNIEAWSEKLSGRLDLRAGDVHEELGKLTDVDRIVLDLPDPWRALEGAARALRPNGLLIAYSPTIRQIDQMVQAILDRPEFSSPDLIETIQRPWIADRMRLRPSLRIIGHTGFLLRTRRKLTRQEAGKLPPDQVELPEEHDAGRIPDPLA